MCCEMLLERLSKRRLLARAHFIPTGSEGSQKLGALSWVNSGVSVIGVAELDAYDVEPYMHVRDVLRFLTHWRTFAAWGYRRSALSG